MEVVQVLHMKGGAGEASYARNSKLQEKALAMSKVIKEEAIHKIYTLFPEAKCIAIVDFGCSSGPNTFVAVRELVTKICKDRLEINKQSPGMSIQVFLNDLPGNDFNSIFKALPSFREELRQEIGDVQLFVHGVPGSFYDQLFQPQSLHLIHSSYSLHWLSQVPKGIGRSHKSNICVSSSSPLSVMNAYYKQFQADFTTFLRHRSEELVDGGCMVITFAGKSDDPFIKGSCYIWDPLAFALTQMVSEGLIKEETLDLFNIPMYSPSPREIEILVKKEGSFEMNCFQVSELDWECAAPCEEGAHVGLAKSIRAVSESMLADQFGQTLMDEVFRRYGEALGDFMAKERTFFTNVTVLLTKKYNHI